MPGFQEFWEVVSSLAKLIPYTDSSKHEKLVQLILELRKLPPRQFKVWGICLVENTEYIRRKMRDWWPIN